LGCDEAQGFFYSPAIPKDKYELLIAQQTAGLKSHL